MATEPTRVRFGILSTANIARKAAIAIREAPNAECVAVASRTLENAQKFAEENFGIPKAYGSYKELLDDPDVDAVYIPLPTGIRKEWVIRAAKANKHVLCEKPVAISVAEAQQMIQACRDHGVLFMDHTMFMHNPRLAAMAEVVHDSKHAVNRVLSSFSFPGDPSFFQSDVRVNRALEPLGCLGDLGWYNIRLSMWAFQWRVPEEVSCSIHQRTEEGVPTDATVCMRWTHPAGVASFDCSFHHSRRQVAEFRGANVSVVIDDFCIPATHADYAFQVIEAVANARNLILPEKSSVSRTGQHLPQHTALIRNFSALVGGKPDADVPPGPFWEGISLDTQLVLDACMSSGNNGGAWTKVTKTEASITSRL